MEEAGDRWGCFRELDFGRGERGRSRIVVLEREASVGGGFAAAGVWEDWFLNFRVPGFATSESVRSEPR